MHTQAILTLEDLYPPLPHVKLDEILEAVSKVLKIARNELISPCRRKDACEARQVYFWVARKFTTYSFPMIARVCGDRDHSTAIHGARKVDLLFPEFESRVSRILRALDIPFEVAA